MFTGFRKKSIAKYLRVHGKLGEEKQDQQMFEAFVNDYCYLDGAFIFQILRRNSNYITASEIICSLWKKFCADYSKQMAIHGAHKSKQADSVEIGMNEYDENPEKKPLRSVPTNSEV